MKSRTLGLVGAACLLAVSIVAGCGKEGEPGPAAEGPKKLVFGLIAKSSTNPVFQAALEGARARAAELTKEYAGKVEVVIDWQTPAEEDAERQANIVRQLANKQEDAIIISCSDANAVTDAINFAVERKGVPVVCFDSDAAASKRFAFYGVDDIETGKLVMKRLAEAMNGKGVVAILAGNQNAPNLQKRVEGVRIAAKDYPGITIKEVYYHVETPEDAANRVMQVMKSNEDITGWAMVGGWPLFTDALLKNWRPGVAVVAVDALPAQLPYVEQGIAPVLLAQQIFHWGYVSVDLAFKKVYLKEKVPERNIADLVPVTKENLGDWARKLKAWNFDVPQKYLDRP